MVDREPDSSAATRQRSGYWVRTKRLTLLLMLVWFAGTFGIIFFARELSAFTFFGWPLSYYLAAQGATLLYTAIVAIYACKMRSLDKTLQNGGSNAE
jgi:putative solute:sodium symporter small subunit